MRKVSDFLKNEYKIIVTVLYTTGVFGIVFSLQILIENTFGLGVKGVAFISAIFLFYRMDKLYKTRKLQDNIEGSLK